MGAGLSMASVNKIKELANSREYSLALELVEHQDLTKSLNPQFLRLCGEIYIKNNKYEDARRCLIMAHRLGPESKRILYTFVELYLRMGYFQLAKKYYDMYMFDAGTYDARQMEYVWNKHEQADNLEALEPLLSPYAHNLDYDWSFELFLLYKKEKKDEAAKVLAEVYDASFRNSENSQIIKDIEAGRVVESDYFDVYAKQEVSDDDPEQEALRKEEQELLEADDLRMHPKEAEITVMYEDSYTPAESEKKVQKMLKKQEKEAEKAEKREKKQLKKQQQEQQRQAQETENTENVSEAAEDDSEKKGFLKNLLRKKKVQENTEEAEETKETATLTEEAEETATSTEEIEEKEKQNSIEEPLDMKSKESEPVEEKTSECAEPAKPENEEPEADVQKAIVETNATGQAEDMRHKKGTIAKDVVVVDEDDGFEAEAETIEELASKEVATTKEPEITVKKPAFEFQTVELAPEDFDEEYEVDDFSETLDDEFGEMKMPETKTEAEAEPENEEPENEEPEEVEEPEPETEPEPEPENEEPEEVEEPESEAEPEPENEEPEEVEEPEAEAEAEPEKEEQEEVEEPEAEAEAEPENEEPEEVEEPEVEAEAEPENEELEEVEEPETEEKEEFHVAPFTTKPEKKKMDFPVFRSSLFPDYHKEVKIVENNFNEIMEEAQDKMSENMQKEEKIQREAEALLASLGISMDSISPSPLVDDKEQPVKKGPSRDELKASLKIDSVKKNLLKRVKEYR